jgi:ATP-dependent Clp protease adaptor protein ClpS
LSTLTLIHKNTVPNTLPSDTPKLDIAVKKSPETQEPPLYRVLLHNDDFTPMDFVVDILQNVFHYEPHLAQKVMLDVHQKGCGYCGIYPYDMAETKVSVVNHRARKYEYPLKCTMEKE